MLLNGEINAALVSDAVELPERIDRWRLFDERYVLVLSLKHPMAKQTVISLQDLQEVVFLKGPDATSQADSSRLVLPTIRALRLCTGAIRKGIFSKWHPPVLGPSWCQSTLQGCRRSPLFQLRATPSGARCSSWPWREGLYSPALDAFIKVARARDWTSALDKLRRASAPVSSKDNVRKADDKVQALPADFTSPGTASSCPSLSRASNRRC